MTANLGPKTGAPAQSHRLDGDLDGRHIEVSVIMPCLNEEAAVAECVKEAWEALAETDLTGEVLVVDNGSTDSSVAVAEGAGARVVHESHRGYGNACRRGLAEARGRFLLLGDADGTYDFSALGDFVTPLLNGADVVMGTRLGGSIESGAMPWLHRHVGNPFLTMLLNALFSPGVSDALCGMRSIKREGYVELTLASPGMEFATELLIEATRQGLHIKEVPIQYRRRRGGVPKLRTFRDGWRSLLSMLAHAAQQSNGSERSVVSDSSQRGNGSRNAARASETDENGL